MRHTPVLLEEVMRLLDVRPGETVIDATLGGGGHSAEMCRRTGDAGIVLGIDSDPVSVREAGRHLADGPCTFHSAKGNFRALDEIAGTHGLARVDKLLFDLGLRSDQLDESGRGFSFRKDGPLDMRFDPDLQTATAAELVNHSSEEELADILRRFGEVRAARPIAKAIVETRRDAPLTRTSELREVVEGTVSFGGRLHPATRVFQAIRIAVNDEIGALEEALAKSLHLLRPGGRIAVISFHSLEDRIVKQFFRARADGGNLVRLTKKPIIPGDEERKENPRSRSAKLRVAARADTEL